MTLCQKSVTADVNSCKVCYLIEPDFSFNHLLLHPLSVLLMYTITSLLLVRLLKADFFFFN